MKVIAPAAGDQGLALIAFLDTAAHEFNRTLDIRLRFLDIGIDLVPVRPMHGQPTVSADAWSNRIRQVLTREGPRLIVIRAGDPAALPAALESAERGVRVVMFVPPDESGAADEILSRCPEATRHEIDDLENPAEGRRLIEILVAERAAT